jgi:hypothetical protein
MTAARRVKKSAAKAATAEQLLRAHGVTRLGQSFTPLRLRDFSPEQRRMLEEMGLVDKFFSDEKGRRG